MGAIEVSLDVVRLEDFWSLRTLVHPVRAHRNLGGELHVCMRLDQHPLCKFSSASPSRLDVLLQTLFYFQPLKSWKALYYKTWRTTPTEQRRLMADLQDLVPFQVKMAHHRAWDLLLGWVCYLFPCCIKANIHRRAARHVSARYGSSSRRTASQHCTG